MREAAKAHDKAAQLAYRAGEVDKAEHHEEMAEGLESHAMEHAMNAGGEWDEDKHPRDEKGRFT